MNLRINGAVFPGGRGILLGWRQRSTLGEVKRVIRVLAISRP